MNKRHIASIAFLSVLLVGCTKSKNIEEKVTTMVSRELQTASQSALPHVTLIDSEKDFIVLMIPHHQEAVENSRLIVSSTQNLELKELAEGLIDAQEKEIQQLQEWHQHWFDETYITGLYEPMMADLTLVEGNKKDALYIKDMITHHQEAVDMAKQVLQRHPRPELQALAQSIVQDQSAEMMTLQGMLIKYEQD